jgi:hypothetical protein
MGKYWILRLLKKEAVSLLDTASFFGERYIFGSRFENNGIYCADKGFKKGLMGIERTYINGGNDKILFLPNENLLCDK